MPSGQQHLAGLDIRTDQSLWGPVQQDETYIFRCYDNYNEGNNELCDIM